MENYVFTNKTSLSNEICNLIIKKYENESMKWQGQTLSGVNLDIKDSIDFVIPKNKIDGAEEWCDIYELLEKELNNNVKEYIHKLDDIINIKYNNSYTTFSKNFLTSQLFQVQRYDKNKGKYIYHNDFTCDWDNKKFRVLTFLWYLNDVDEGGETEFWGNYKIKPERGKLILFPASWVFPHSGLMPISNDKYIITGWLYLHE
jgi:hypothetical protein